MAGISLQQEEVLAEKVKLFPVLYDKKCKGYKERDFFFLKLLFLFLLSSNNNNNSSSKVWSMFKFFEVLFLQFNILEIRASIVETNA